MLANSPIRYGSIARLFHWLMAMLFLGMYTVAYIMINMQRSPLMFSLYDLHKAIGLLLLALVFVRLSWRTVNVEPDASSAASKWQHHMASINVMLLYLIMFGMPLSGIMTSTLGGHDIKFFNVFSMPALANDKVASLFFSNFHFWLSWTLVGLVALHAVAALGHHFVLKDDTLKRML